MFQYDPNQESSVPIINLRGAPDAEQSAIIRLNFALGRLRRYESDFNAALSLFDFCEHQKNIARSSMKTDPFKYMDISQQLTAWQFVAGRDAALTIYHFGWAIDGVNNASSKCKSLFPLIDNDLRRKARRLFDDNFPRNAAMRHAVAHSAEFANKPDEHAYSGPYREPGVIIEDVQEMNWNSLNNRTFSLTFEGEIFAFDITAETAAILRQSTVALFSAFAPLEKSSHDAFIAKMVARSSGQSAQATEDQNDHPPESAHPHSEDRH